MEIKSYNSMHHNINMDIVVASIAAWHHDRNLVNGSTDKAQFLKLVEEMGELASSLAKGTDIIDDVGDILVVLINIMERHGLSMRQCLHHAYDDIKDRKGMMIDGVFVKDA